MHKVLARAPGKCILFGEHSVVYGYSAIAMAISVYSSCVIEEVDEKKIQLFLKDYNELLEFTNLESLNSRIPSQFNQISRCLNLFNKKFKLNFENIKIVLFSSLIPSSGLGSSASIAVALVSAISSFYNLNLDRKEISAIAFEMEKVKHGTPSGIDNTICTFGNLIIYQKSEFRLLDVPNDLSFLVTYTNIEHDTKKAVESVKQFKENNPQESSQIFKKMENIAKNAEIGLKNGDLNQLGNLMNENQKYLTKLGVSNKIISKIINIALKNGAVGSKLTGAGCGGCVISLGTESVLNNISKILKEKGFINFLTNIDREGVKIIKS